MKRYLFIVNPNAGRGKGQKIIPVLKDYLHRHSIPHEVWETSARLEAVVFTQDGIKAGFDVLVAVGGDGTIHEVANGIIRSNESRPLGAIRVGSGNDFLRYFKFPTDLEQAMAILLQGREITIDAGKVGNHYFVNAIGVGFDAEVGYEMLKIQWLAGTAVYVYAAFKRLLKFRTPYVKVVADDFTFEGPITLVTVGNGTSSGGGFMLTPQAKMDDGWFDVCLVKAVPRWKVMTILLRVLTGGHIHHPDVIMTRAKKVVIDSAQDELLAHLEGEFADLDPHHIEVNLIRSCLRVIVP